MNICILCEFSLELQISEGRNLEKVYAHTIVHHVQCCRISDCVVIFHSFVYILFGQSVWNRISTKIGEPFSKNPERPTVTVRFF